MSIIREDDRPLAAIIGAFAAAVLGLALWLGPAPAVEAQGPQADRSKPVSGDVVSMAWDCLPTFSPNGEMVGLACASEDLTISRIEADGWWTVIETTEKGQRTWRVNPARATAYSIKRAPAVATVEPVKVDIASIDTPCALPVPGQWYRYQDGDDCATPERLDVRLCGGQSCGEALSDDIAALAKAVNTNGTVSAGPPTIDQGTR